MATATAKPRKQLADQLDRLDGIIDLLADGLPAAVADATRAGTRHALVELLADPDVIARLKAALTPEAPDRSDLIELKTIPKRSSYSARFRAVGWNAAVETGRIAEAGIAALANRATAASSSVKAAFVRNFRIEVPVVRYAAAALAAGAVAAIVGYTVPQEYAAALCGLGATGVSAALLLGARIRRSLRSRAVVPPLTGFCVDDTSEPRPAARTAVSR